MIHLYSLLTKCKQTKQNRSTEGCWKLKRSVDMTSSGKMVSTLEQIQVPNGTGPGVRRSKRPLLASHTRCNVLWKPPKFGNKVKIGIKAQFGNNFANCCSCLIIVEFSVKHYYHYYVYVLNQILENLVKQNYFLEFNGRYIAFEADTA